MESYVSFVPAPEITRTNRLRTTLHQEAVKEISRSVFPFGGDDVTDDGVDINITFPCMSQAFTWADVFGVSAGMGLVSTAYGPVTSFASPVRVYVVGYDYAITQLGRDDHRSYEFGANIN